MRNRLNGLKKARPPTRLTFLVRTAQIILVSSLLLLMEGCSESSTQTIPHQATLLDSGGNGGWMLFDSAPETFSSEHCLALEEQAKVKITGAGLNSATRKYMLIPVTVLSGKYAGRAGWVASSALQE